MADTDHVTKRDDNESFATVDSTLPQSEDTSDDPNKLIRQHPSGVSKGRGMTNDRDLGTVGGGTIPSPDAAIGSGNPPGGMNISNDTVTTGGIPAGHVTGSGATSDRGKMTNSDVAGNAIDRHAQGNIGGRNPIQPQTAMGDRDAKKGRSDQGEREGRDSDITEPMTSRDPSKIKQPED